MISLKNIIAQNIATSISDHVTQFLIIKDKAINVEENVEN